MTAKQDKSLKLGMDQDEAFERFLGVKPEELPEHVRLRQGKGPPKRPQVVDVKPVTGPVKRGD